MLHARFAAFRRGRSISPRARSIDCPRGYEVALTHSPGENRPKRAFILGENRVYSPIRDHNSRSPSIPLCWSLLREIVIYIALGSSAGGEKNLDHYV